MTAKQLLSNPLTKQIVTSFGIVFIVACAIAGTLHFWWHLSFWAPFILAVIGQFIAFFILNTILEQVTVNRTAKQIAEMQANAVEKSLANQSITLECAYCNTVNVVPIILSQENVFKCFQCSQDNAVQLKFFAARTTRPVARKVELDLAEQGLSDELIEKTNKAKEK